MKFLDENIFKKEDTVKAEKIWTERIAEYKKLYDTVKIRLKKDFLREYEKQYFHDYLIVSIFPEKKKNYKYSINVILKHHNDIFRIVYEDVKEFRCNIALGSSLTRTDLLQSEILPVDDKHISHEFTLSGIDENSIFIVCKNISLIKQ